MSYESTNKKKFFISSIFIFTFFIAPVFSYANVSITEIMYDVSGSDTGREWIEVKADAGTDLSDWKLFEANTNHGLTLAKGSALIPVGGFAVIADNTEKFLLDFPSFSGTLFDSSFSLSNTGETISIRNAELADVDSVSYTSEQGAAGDGNSLQKINGVWTVAVPTPGGGENQQQTTDNQQQEQGTTNVPAQTGTTQTSGASVPMIEPTIKAYAGPDRTVLSGADVLFEGKATGLTGEPMMPERFSWNFGDGTVADGENVRHTFRYPGVYVVNLNTKSGKYAASDYARVTAIPADIIISSADPAGAYVEIRNSVGSDIDVSLFRIRANSKDFMIPDHTVLSAKTAVRFHSSATSLAFQKGDALSLLYPNGEVLAVFSWNIPIAQSPITEMYVETRTIPPPASIAEVKIAREENETADESAYVATAESADIPVSGTQEFVWWAALVLVAGLSAGSVVWVRKKERTIVPKDELSADDFDIVDITEK